MDMTPVENDAARGLNGALAAVLRGELAASDLRQQDLADRSGIPLISVSRYLNAKRHIDVKALAALAEALDLTARELVEAAESRLVRMDEIAARDED